MRKLCIVVLSAMLLVGCGKKTETVTQEAKPASYENTYDELGRISTVYYTTDNGEFDGWGEYYYNDLYNMKFLTIYDASGHKTSIVISELDEDGKEISVLYVIYDETGSISGCYRQR